MLTKNIVKYIQSLNLKKNRDKEGLFLAETPKVVEELLKAGSFECQSLFAVADWIDSRKSLLIDCGEVHVIDDHDLERLSKMKSPHQVLAVFKMENKEGIPDLHGKLSLVLDDIQDPGNVGTLIRIADWFGIENIICSPHCANRYAPKVVQATMGSLARVHIHYAKLVPFILEQKIPVYVATLSGSSVYQQDPPDEGLLVIGNESRGVQNEILELADFEVSIPRSGQAESLNASVAAGILLSWLKR